MHDAEDGRRGADAERQRDDGDGGEDGRVPERAPGVVDVAAEIVEPGERADWHHHPLRALHAMCYKNNTTRRGKGSAVTRCRCGPAQRSRTISVPIMLGCCSQWILVVPSFVMTNDCSPPPRSSSVLRKSVASGESATMTCAALSAFTQRRRSPLKMVIGLSPNAISPSVVALGRM